MTMRCGTAFLCGAKRTDWGELGLRGFQAFAPLRVAPWSMALLTRHPVAPPPVPIAPSRTEARGTYLPFATLAKIPDLV
jgi:hypothetical protein